MRSFISAASLSIIAASLVACAEPDTTDVLDAPEEPAFETRNGNGSNGTNRLSELDFGSEKMFLARAARLHPLLAPGTNHLSTGVQTLLGNSLAAQHVIKYAIECTVPEGTSVNAYGQSIAGLGHLTTGAAWLTGPLPHAAINDLMACMIAHVNAFNVPVPIQLFGANVEDDLVPHSEISVSEARWVAHVNVDDVTSFTVWPSTYVKRSCEDTLSALRDRACGQWPAGCNLELGVGSCTYNAVTKGYDCNGAPAIETKLRPEDLPLLYRVCQ